MGLGNGHIGDLKIVHIFIHFRYFHTFFRFYSLFSKEEVLIKNIKVIIEKILSPITNIGRRNKRCLREANAHRLKFSSFTPMKESDKLK